MLKELLEIYVTFFKMGSVTFGGGYAMLPILRRELVQNKKWIDEETIMDYYALSQGLPGIIAANVATFIGYRKKGVPGAIAAVLGVVSPCVVIISIIAACLSNFKDNPYVRHALSGISVCVIALILDSVMGLWKKGVKDKLTFGIFAVMLALSVFTKISPILLVITCALLGIGIKSFGRRSKDGGENK